MTFVFKIKQQKTSTPKERLLKQLPKKFHERVVDLTEEEGLIDNCKYILHYSKDFTDGEVYGGTLPTKSITEAIRFVKDLSK